MFVHTSSASPTGDDTKAAHLQATRSRTWDVAKGIGILLVVYGHVARGLMSADIPMDRAFHQAVDTVIYSFHMPLFFFMAGIFLPQSLARHGRAPLLLGKVRTILYPYLVWSLLQGTIEVMLAGLTNGHTTFSEVLTLLWQPRAQFWYLHTLFVLFLVSTIAYWHTTLRWVLGVAGIAALFHYLPLPSLDFFAINAFKQWFVFFALGAACASPPPLTPARGRLALGPCLALFAGAEWALLQPPIALPSMVVQILPLGAACAGIALVLAFAHGFGGRATILGEIGKRSLEIYLAHILVASGVRIVLTKFLGVTNMELHLILGTAVGIAGPLLLYLIADRYGFRWLFSLPSHRRPVPESCLPPSSECSEGTTRSLQSST